MVVEQNVNVINLEALQIICTTKSRDGEKKEVL